MKILDIVQTTATLIAREDVVNYLSQSEGKETSIDTLESVYILTRLSNLVIRELAEGLIVMKKKVEVAGKKSVNFVDLDISPLDVIAVYGRDGEKLDCSVSSYGVSVGEGLIYTIEYSYLPETYDLNDIIGEFEKPISLGTLSYGVAAEYLLTEARFDEAIMWHARFVEGVNALIRPKNGRVKGRKFV